jgi:hypothetical protein
MFNKFIGVAMKAKYVVALLVASSAALAATAFAGGYGPAPFYRPDVGAPTSQRGQSTQTMAAEKGQGGVIDESDGGVGDSGSTRSQTGGRVPADSIDPMYRGG